MNCATEHGECDGPRHTLVFSFVEQLTENLSLGGPEQNYLKWVELAVAADLCLSGDEAERSDLSADMRKAWRIYHDALQATFELQELSTTSPQLLRRIGNRMSFLPCLLSRHPGADQFNRDYFEQSNVGRPTPGELEQNARHLAHQSWPVRYAYAIINTIGLTLDTYSESLEFWREVYGYGIRHPIPSERIEAVLKMLGCSEAKKARLRKEHQGAYKVLPKWTKGLELIQQPMTPAHVMQYWRKGREIILEEMPDFHERAEWESYRRRRYANGPKPSAIQHAIFKDILDALKTISGANKGRRRRSTPSSRPK